MVARHIRRHGEGVSMRISKISWVWRSPEPGWATVGMSDSTQHTLNAIEGLNGGLVKDDNLYQLIRKVVSDGLWPQ